MLASIWSTITGIFGFLWFAITWIAWFLWTAIVWIASFLWFAVTWTAWFLWTAIVWIANSLWFVITWIAGVLWSAVTWFGSLPSVSWLGGFLFKYVLLPVIGLSVTALSIYLLYLSIIFIIGALYGDEWIKQRIYSQKIFSIDTITSTTCSVRRCSRIVTELEKKGELERIELEEQELYKTKDQKPTILHVD